MQLSDIGAPGAGTLYTYGFEDLVEDDWDSLGQVLDGVPRCELGHEQAQVDDRRGIVNAYPDVAQHFAVSPGRSRLGVHDHGYCDAHNRDYASHDRLARGLLLAIQLRAGLYRLITLLHQYTHNILVYDHDHGALAHETLPITRHDPARLWHDDPCTTAPASCLEGAKVLRPQAHAPVSAPPVNRATPPA
ncbi:hypothetical protein A1Q1_02113 [Trichosporon asahii var. asahii CBS 2479]|uniref:Uncharacterized protein n=1 Tax=Trichosporon asahii var. asahii (strain ATCC 90039 / CBS 2479 / JCM 2466 / KCTC 7840 / NBRC 103889/ NCYC 2677 / UAMH 7654) TaxID=1186058 RepID=J6EW50_TRIAS|nr:hypothetical protein A1Q1_02113 [Trichosporon asahii var. asahii CBS 2479]EJT48854.1 hypothetical protein A1Q1_02113 [Trichosporon asahii var. asahii CBS 2479]